LKILILSKYGVLGSSSRIRFYQYIPYLESHDVKVTISSFLGDEYLQRLYADRSQPISEIIQSYARRLVQMITASGFDLVWLEKELFPFFPAWGEGLLRLLKIPYVVDYDDATFHAYDQHPNRVVRTLLGDKIDQVMRRAALVVAGNDYLAKHAIQAGAKRVECLPSVVDLERYLPTPIPTQDVFTIGWMGIPMTAILLKLVEPALAQVCRDGRGRLVLVGSGNVELTDVPLEVHSWNEVTEVDQIQSFDVGIMPLIDDPWCRGKCGYKLIQFMACGRPVVASPVGVNRQIVDHGVNGFLASTPEEWARALEALRDNHEMRHEMGKAARKKVEAEYSLQVTAPRLLALLRSVAGEAR
jgi:glycosyltransferase involved in cell wall biosynthesis